MPCCAYSCTQYGLLTQYMLLTHAGALLCLQLHTVRSAYTVHASNPCWCLAVPTAARSSLNFCITSKVFNWLTLVINRVQWFWHDHRINNKMCCRRVWTVLHSISYLICSACDIPAVCQIILFPSLHHHLYIWSSIKSMHRNNWQANYCSTYKHCFNSREFEPLNYIGIYLYLVNIRKVSALMFYKGRRMINN